MRNLGLDTGGDSNEFLPSKQSNGFHEFFRGCQGDQILFIIKVCKSHTVVSSTDLTGVFFWKREFKDQTNQFFIRNVATRIRNTRQRYSTNLGLTFGS